MRACLQTDRGSCEPSAPIASPEPERPPRAGLSRPRTPSSPAGRLPPRPNRTTRKLAWSGPAGSSPANSSAPTPGWTGFVSFSIPAQLKYRYMFLSAISEVNALHTVFRCNLAGASRDGKSPRNQSGKKKYADFWETRELFRIRRGQSAVQAAHSPPGQWDDPCCPFDRTMSVTIVLFYTFVTLFMFLSYNPKPKKIIESIRSFLLHLLQLNGGGGGGAGPTDGPRHSSASCNTTNHGPEDDGDDEGECVPQVKSIWEIPGPRRLPLIGTKWLYFTGRQRYSKVHEAFLDLHRRYGKIVLDVDTVPIVNLFDRADMEKVLKYPSRYPFRPPTEIIEVYRRSRPDRFGVTNLINAQGDKWHELRLKLTSGITSRRILQSFIPSVNEICDDFVDLVRRQRAEDGTIRNFQDIANSVGLEIICCLVLGRRMGYLTTDRRNEKFIRLAEAVKESFVHISKSYYGFKLWKYVPTRLYRNFVRCEEIIYDTIAEIVYEALEEEQLNCPDNDVKHIFISILQTEGLETKEKISGIIDLITSAIETLSNTLSFLLHNLSQSVEHQRAIAHEFSHCAKSITNEDLVSAGFTKACIQESYRISPTTPCLARILEEDFQLSGYHLQAGTLVLCHTRVACQSEDNFHQADRFLPERWLDQHDENHNVVYKRQEPGAPIVLPFGIGRRMCPGQKIVDIELTLLVAKIFQNFEIEYRSPLDTQFQFLLAPRTPIEIRFRDRQ